MFGKNGFLGMGSNRLNVGKNERWMSTIAGVALLATAFLGRRKGLGKVAGLVGGMLMKRGMTGRCELYTALGRNTNTRFS